MESIHLLAGHCTHCSLFYMCYSKRLDIGQFHVLLTAAFNAHALSKRTPVTITMMTCSSLPVLVIILQDRYDVFLSLFVTVQVC